jgi:hypothetical protein
LEKAVGGGPYDGEGERCFFRSRATAMAMGNSLEFAFVL